MPLLQLLTADEVAALANTFAGRLDDGQRLPFPLTAKLVENALEGARKVPGDKTSCLYTAPLPMHLMRRPSELAACQAVSFGQGKRACKMRGA